MHEKALVADLSPSPSFGITTSKTVELESPSHSDTAVLSSLPSLQAESCAHPIDYDLEEKETHLKGNDQETESGSELAMLKSVTELNGAVVLPNHTEIKVEEVDIPSHEIESSAATVASNWIGTGVVELDEPNNEIIEEVHVDKYSGNDEDSVRRELYTFYEANQSDVPTLENSDTVKPVSHPSSSKPHTVYPPTRNSINGAKNSTLDVLHTSGCLAETIFVAEYTLKYSFTSYKHVLHFMTKVIMEIVKFLLYLLLSVVNDLILQGIMKESLILDFRQKFLFEKTKSQG